jgi:hypothetical protein
VATTDDSVLFYETSGAGSWDTLAGGTYGETGSSLSFGSFTNIAGPSSSLLFYDHGSDVAAIAALQGGTYDFTGTVSGFSTDWKLVAGGK